MRYKVLLLFLSLFCSTMVSAQVRFTDDPNIAINLDIEAESKSSLLLVSTYSRTSQILPDPYVVITFMNDSVISLTGRGRNANKAIKGDIGHGFADKFNSEAGFIMTPAQTELFKEGIKSLMIRMSPNAYYHEWKNDEIGKPLYARYLISRENVLFKTKKKESRN